MNRLFTHVKHILYYFTFRSFIFVLLELRQHLTFITEMYKTTWQGRGSEEGLVQRRTPTLGEQIFLTPRLKLVQFTPSEVRSFKWGCFVIGIKLYQKCIFGVLK